MEDVLRQFNSLHELKPSEIVVNLLDIVLVAYLIYRLLLLVRGTRAWRFLIGVIAFLVADWLSAILHLNTLHWILDKATLLGPVALVILFLPELRQTIEGFGKLTPLQILNNVASNNVEERAEARTVEELTAAMAELAAERIGALVVIEREASLNEIAANGILLNARVSAPLLLSIFYENNPLHDGAVILRSDILVAAACQLPLTESSRLDQNVHMRHRAAVGVTEALDCIAVVVSEERGTISWAADGRLQRLSSHLELRDLLNKELRHLEPEKPAKALRERSRSRRNRDRRKAEVKQ